VRHDQRRGITDVVGTRQGEADAGLGGRIGKTCWVGKRGTGLADRGFRTISAAGRSRLRVSRSGVGQCARRQAATRIGEVRRTEGERVRRAVLHRSTGSRCGSISAQGSRCRHRDVVSKSQRRGDRVPSIVRTNDGHGR